MTGKGYLKATLALALIALFISACAPTIKVRSLKPARINKAAHLNKITVLTFDGSGGKIISRRLKETLEDIYIEGEPYFSVVGEDTFYDRASGRKCRACRDDKHILTLAKATGADAVLAGSITENSCTAELYEEKETRCIEQAILKKDAKPECVKWRDFYIPCVKNTHTYEFKVRLVEISSGHYLYTDTFDGDSSTSECQQNRRGGDRYRSTLREHTNSRYYSLQCRAEWRDTLSVKAFNEALYSARQIIPRKIAPYYEWTTIALMYTNVGITTAQGKASFAEGIKLAKKAKLTHACPLWKEARVLNPHSPALSFNLGVCAEFKNNLSLADTLYRKAAEQLGTENRMITEALSRNAQNKKDINALSNQLNKQKENRRHKKRKK